MYGNGTIRLPQNLIDKLRMKKGDKLVVSEKHDGFVVCKIEDYSQNWMDKFDREWRELDAELRRIFTKDLNTSNKKYKEKEKLSEQSEVL